ncbi:MAG: hypothetical protein ABIA21_01155 [Candidatus Aenigmatarchaeota archaeon]
MRKKIKINFKDGTDDARIVREISKILSVNDDNIIKTVEKFLDEITNMKGELTKHEVRQMNKTLNKM